MPPGGLLLQWFVLMGARAQTKTGVRGGGAAAGRARAHARPRSASRPPPPPQPNQISDRTEGRGLVVSMPSAMTAGIQPQSSTVVPLSCAQTFACRDFYDSEGGGGVSARGGIERAASLPTKSVSVALFLPPTSQQHAPCPAPWRPCPCREGPGARRAASFLFSKGDGGDDGEQRGREGVALSFVVDRRWVAALLVMMMTLCRSRV